ncbi:MAG: L-threonylcarbamoyladenylate synthase [Dehalococcoidia bacterium]
MSPSDDLDLNNAVEVLRQGGLVAYPTDTLYGLGAHAFLKEAVDRVYAAKGRQGQKAVPLLLSSTQDLRLVADKVPELAVALANRFWPGALTLVVRCSAVVPRQVTGGGNKVAVRVPGHPVPRELVRRLEAPITGTSANRSGGANPVSADDVRAQLGTLVDVIIDGGPCPGDRPSTVVDVTGERPVLVREGVVSRDDVEEVCGALLHS